MYVSRLIQSSDELNDPRLRDSLAKDFTDARPDMATVPLEFTIGWNESGELIAICKRLLT